MDWEDPNQSQPKIERQSRFFSAASLEGTPVKPRGWLCEGLIPNRNVTLLGGDGGTGKSLLALQLTVSVVIPECLWLGRKVSHGRAVYISAEDDKDELHRRLDDILKAYGKTYKDVEGLTLRSLAGEDALLAREGTVLEPTDLFAEIEQLATTVEPAVIVLDTLADLYPANENDRAKVRQFIGLLRGLALRQDCVVLLLGHPSLSGLSSGTGSSGSTAWNNSVRSRNYLERVTSRDGKEANPDKRVLKVMKANYGPIGEEITMTWQAGVFVVEAAPTGLDRVASDSKADRVFLKLLDERNDQGRPVNPNSGPSYAPAVFAEHQDSEGINKTGFKVAMERLLQARQIKVTIDGPPSRRTQRLVRVRP